MCGAGDLDTEALQQVLDSHSPPPTAAVSNNTSKPMLPQAHKYATAPLVLLFTGSGCSHEEADATMAGQFRFNLVQRPRSRAVASLTLSGPSVSLSNSNSSRGRAQEIFSISK